MSPVGLYCAFALILVAAALVGWAAMAATGRREWSWLAPALGLAVLVVVCGATVYLPGHGTTATIAFAAAVLASGAVLSRGPVDSRRALRSGLPVVLVVVLAASVPFAAGGGFEVIGSYVNNDLAFHIYNAEWLRAHEGIEPQQVADGYPTGPHGLVVAVSGLTPIDIPAAWMGLLIATAAATALAALGVIERLHPILRTLGALLVGLSYLGASFYVQSAFKETMMALFALGFALALREAAREGSGAAPGGRRDRARAVVGPAAFASAAFATYSGPGLALVAGTLGVWIVATLLLGTTRAAILDAVRRRRWALPVAVVGVALAAVILFAVWDQAAGYIGGRDVIGEDALVNLFELLSALAAAIAAYLVGRYSLGPYVGSKALAVMAPLVMLFAVVGVAPGPDDREDWARWGRRSLLVVFVGLALCSSYVALAGARLDNDDHDEQLAQFWPVVAGERVLFLGSDEYVPWELRGASVESAFGTAPGLYADIKPLARLQPSERADFDTTHPSVLDEFDYVITTNAAYGSAPPANFRPVDSTASFTLWERTGLTPDRKTLRREGEIPGAELDCERRRGQAISERRGTAYVAETPPVVASFGELLGEDVSEGSQIAWVDEGEPQSVGLRLTPGRWEISLQYFSTEPLVIDSPGLLHLVMPPNSTRIGPYWAVGAVEIEEPRDVEISVEPVERPFLRRLLGGPDAVRTGPQTIIGMLAAARLDEQRRALPTSEACGRFVDWYELTDSS
jgi:hypothetical protein